MFTVIASTTGAEYVVDGYADAHDLVVELAEEAGLYGGTDIHGTYAVAYCGHDNRPCGGHEVARVFDTVAMNETTAANLAATRASHTPGWQRILAH